MAQRIKMLGRSLCCALLLFSASECSSGTKDRQADASVKDVQEDVVSSVQHEVQEGQTLWDIARAYDLRVADILKANNIRPAESHLVRVGQKLTVPGVRKKVEVETAEDRKAKREAARAALPDLKDGAYHFLASGESLWSVARLYDVPLDTILARNKLSDDAANALKPGEPIIVPGIKESDIKQTESQVREGFFHTLESGQKHWDLAGSFGVAVSEIMAANSLKEAQVKALREGDQIWIPGVTRDKKGIVSRRTTQRERGATQQAKGLGLGTRQAASQILRGAIKASWGARPGAWARYQVL
ncbi:MAG: LysM peptidoglycan-binding domain-containing protein [Myxococcales bacterium]|nr:MAG: LysM peptidoglycan-binding domain-containing protein [Myxococcales bacterium]